MHLLANDVLRKAHNIHLVVEVFNIDHSLMKLSAICFQKPCVDNFLLGAQSFVKLTPVKPVYNEHPRDPKIVAVVDRWLFRDHLRCKGQIWDFKMMVVAIQRW